MNAEQKMLSGPAESESVRLRWPGITLTTRRLLIVIFAVAVLLRLASAIYQGNAVDTLPGVYDQVSYTGLAERVVGGFGFSFGEGHWPATRAGEPTAHWSYLYTLFISAVYALFGTQPVVARLIQAVLVGILHIWLVWRIGNRVFGPPVAVIAAAMSAVYIYFFYYAGALVTETFYIVGILWVIDTTFRLVEPNESGEAAGASASNRWWLWIELGLAMGVTVLLRQVFLLFAPILYVWIWWNRAEKRRLAASRVAWRVRSASQPSPDCWPRRRYWPC